VSGGTASCWACCACYAAAHAVRAMYGAVVVCAVLPTHAGSMCSVLGRRPSVLTSLPLWPLKPRRTRTPHCPWPQSQITPTPHTVPGPTLPRSRIRNPNGFIAGIIKRVRLDGPDRGAGKIDMLPRAVRHRIEDIIDDVRKRGGGGGGDEQVG